QDALRVRVEVVPGLQVAGQQQDDLRIGVIRAGAVVTTPQRHAEACTRGADVGVRVVTVHSPGAEEPFGEAVLTRSSDVVHHVLVPPLDDGGADARGDVVEGSVPVDVFPFAAATFACAPQRVQDPFRVVELIDRGGPFGAVTSPRAGVCRVSLQFFDGEVFFVDVGEHPACGLA